MSYWSKLLMSLSVVAALGLSGCAARKASVSYETPEKTFATWKRAAEDLDIPLLVDSYARSARPGIEEELKRLNSEALEAMKSETKKTNFKIEKIVYEDNLAYLRIRRQLNKSSEIEVLTMVKEDGRWKLLP